MLQQLYNTVDSIVVGNFLGSEALAAVGSSSSLIMLLISFSMGAAAGAGVIVSQFIGAQNKKGIHESVHTALAIALILGVVLTAAGLILSPQILRWMGTPEEVMPQSITYLRLYFAGVIFSILYNMASGILNAVGNSKRALLYLAIASFTNIILDLLFIPVLKMGIAGAAIATDISQLLSAVLCMLYLMRVNESYKVVLRKIRIHKTVAIRIIQVGVPTAIQNTVISFANVLVQASVNSYGALAMAGFAAYIKIDGFNILPVMSFSMAATTFSGQNYGAGNMERVRKGMRVTVAMGVIYCICVGSILLLFGTSADRYLFQRSDGHRIWCKSHAVLLPILFPAGHYAWTGRRHPRNRKICSANGHYPVLTLCLPRDLDPAGSTAHSNYRWCIHGVSDFLVDRCNTNGYLYQNSISETNINPKYLFVILSSKNPRQDLFPARDFYLGRDKAFRLTFNGNKFVFLFYCFLLFFRNGKA